jgi:hypothetical protein
MTSKKIFGLTAALLLSVFAAGGLWAQELKLDGYINSGLGFVANDNEDNEPYMKAFGVDSESNGWRLRLNGSYTNEAKNAGARFRLQSQRNISESGYFSIPYAYGWVGFLESKLTLTGGLIMDSTWETADWWWQDDLGEGLGLLIKAEPVKGLNLGLGAYTISQQSGGNNNRLRWFGSSGTPNLAAITPNWWDVKYTMNASYTMPNAFRLNLSYRHKNMAGGNNTDKDPDTGDHLYRGREESSFFLGEFRFLGVKDLTAVLVGMLDNLQNFDDAGNITITETFGYKISDDLSLGLNATQFLYNRGDTDMNPGLLFNLWGSYAFGNVIPRLDLAYFLGGQSKLAASDRQWERKGFVNVAKAKDADEDYSVFSIRPSVRINLDGRTFIEIGDMINIDSSNLDGAYKDSGDANKSSLFSNVFYIDFKWSF